MSALLAADGGLLAHLNDWNTTVFLLINGLHSPAWDAILRRDSSPWVLVLAHLLVVLAILRWPDWQERGRRLALVLLIVWAAAVGYSRIYIGLHFPGDVLGGTVWGMTVAAVVWWASTLVHPLAHPRAQQPAVCDAANDARTPHALAEAATTT